MRLTPRADPTNAARNLIRTRLQAQGTPAHPQRYDGVRDAAARCYHGEGWRGFYKGTSTLRACSLTRYRTHPDTRQSRPSRCCTCPRPCAIELTLAQISYAVYDLTKKALFAREELESQREHDSQEE